MADGTLLRNLHKVARCLHDGLGPKCGSTNVITRGHLCCQESDYISSEQDSDRQVGFVRDSKD